MFNSYVPISNYLLSPSSFLFDDYYGDVDDDDDDEPWKYVDINEMHFIYCLHYIYLSLTTKNPTIPFIYICIYI